MRTRRKNPTLNSTSPRTNIPHSPKAWSLALIAWLWLSVFLSGAANAAESTTLRLKHVLEITGSTENPLSLPSDVAVSDQRVYVVDGGNDRVAVFDLFGKFLFAFGGSGAKKGRMNGPVGIGIGQGQGQNNNVYIADTGNQRVQVFTAKGKYLANIPIKSAGKPVRPVDVAVDAAAGEIYVTGNNNHKVMVFAENGKLKREWGGNGLNAGQFRYPATLTLMPDGRLAVVDVLNTRVQIFHSSGSFSTEVGEWGVLPGQLFRPKGIAVDAKGRFYISDSYLNVVQVYESSGTFMQVMKVPDNQPPMQTPTGMTFDGNGRLYVVQMVENRISVFAPQP